MVSRIEIQLNAFDIRIYITIEIARNACRTLKFDCAVEMIELGRTKARE
jgi:hypothetical protein